MSKPKWARLAQEAAALAEQAKELADSATDLRCKAKESGGLRCTADRGEYPHIHRISKEDLPEGWNVT